MQKKMEMTKIKVKITIKTDIAEMYEKKLEAFFNVQYEYLN